jgi:hypothetical protein
LNILRRIYERLVDIATGTFLIEVDLPGQAQEVLEELAKISGLKPSTVMRVISAEALLKDPAFNRHIHEESDSAGAT